MKHPWEVALGAQMDGFEDPSLDVSPFCHALSILTIVPFGFFTSFVDSVHGHCELVRPCRGELHALHLSIDHHSSHIDMDRLLVPDEDQCLVLEVEVPLAILGLEGQFSLEM